MQPKRATRPAPAFIEQVTSPPQSALRIVRARDDAAGADKGPAARPRILIVEDDFLVADQVAAALDEAGFEPAGVANSAEEALEMARLRRPALVVMDVRLVGVRDGVDAALELCRSHGIRCIFATAHHNDDVRRRAQPASPLAWLQKPYTMASLVQAVRNALSELER